MKSISIQKGSIDRMKYIIESDGKEFKCKIKHFLFWHYVKHYTVTGCIECPVISSPATFKSEVTIVKLIKEIYGQSVIRVRKWRYV